MSIKMKMILGIIGTLSLFLISTLATQWIVNKTNHTISVVVDDNGLKLELLDSLKNTAYQREIQLLNLALLDADSDNYDDNLVSSKKDLKGSSSTILNYFNQLNKLNFKKSESEVYDDIKSNMTEANAAFGSFITAIDEGFPSEALDIMKEDFRPKYEQFSNNVAR